MNRFIFWVFAKRRFTYWDIAAFIVSGIIGGLWGLAFLVVSLMAGAFVGHLAELWREDEERGKL